MASLLFTGASGFLGRALLPLLEREYDLIDTLGRSPGCSVCSDLAYSVLDLPRHYDCVLHAAAMAHYIPRDDSDVLRMFRINLGGTRRLCEALEAVGVPHSLVFISTVAVYGCVAGSDIGEEHPLDGDTPYARSKILAESFLAAWCRKHGVILSIIRPPLILGKGAPGNLGAMVEGIRRGRYLSIGGGKALKSFVTPEYIAAMISRVREKGGVYNAVEFDIRLADLEAKIADRYSCRSPGAVPLWLGRAVGLIGSILGLRIINIDKVRKLTSSLTFSSRKAKNELGME